MTIEKNNANDERGVRLKKLDKIRSLGIDPFPARLQREHSLSEALSAEEGKILISAGRIMTKREMGKLTFCHFQDSTGKMQIALRQEELGKESYDLFLSEIDPGDIVSVRGEKFITHKGEPSILVKEWTVLSKALLPLPDKFHGLNDEEVRYRKRYLDFLVNPVEKEKILVRGKILRYIREFLQSENFVEVETPVLETISSGAMAKTFDTHLNAYDLDVHLRICMGELWQKRLLVGGFEKTFEMGRAFRNEGVDHQHNPEFTMLEYYWAYADYEDNMKFHEKLIPFVVEKSIGQLEVEVEGQQISFKAPYPRITFHEAVLKHSGIDINEYSDIEELKKVMVKKGYDHEGLTERGKILDNLYKQSTRPKIIQPTFVLNYPIELKPLAKKSEDPRYTEMFQLIVNGFELSNSYTELNDPVDQRKRFEDQAKNKAAGDEEAMENDWDYVEALEYGMPPATGTGIGIDRFAALITGSHTLREVTAFPLMKPLSRQDSVILKKDDSDIKEIFVLPITREEAWKLVLKYNKKQANLNHYLESEVVMRKLAEKLNEDVEAWGMLGLLHDIDWELTETDSQNHLTKAPEILKTAGFQDNFIEVIISHGYGCNCAGLENKKRIKKVEYALACAETVTGLIYTAALMREDKINSLKVDSLLKKFKDKKFAAKVDREVIKECEKLGLSLEDFLQIALDAIKGIAKQINL